MQTTYTGPAIATEVAGLHIGRSYQDISGAALPAAGRFAQDPVLHPHIGENNGETLFAAGKISEREPYLYYVSDQAVSQSGSSSLSNH